LWIKAKNTGLSLCKNDIVIFSDDDVTVQSDALRNVMEIMKNQRIVMIAGINNRDKFSTLKLGYLFGRKSYIKRNIGYVTSAIYEQFP
jgi:cellulose synthase/poly-beta-1,6-N-acetylglucosamine synthase-like glycosyltransferase